MVINGAARSDMLAGGEAAGYPLYAVPGCATFSELLECSAARYGDDIAFEGEDRVWSYREVDDAARRTAHRLGDLRGALVPVTATHPVLFIAVLAGVAEAGGEVVLLPPGGLAMASSLGALEPEVDDGRAAELSAPGPIARRSLPGEGDPDSPRVVVMSSGTTGAPKAIELSERNILSDVRGGMALYEYARGARYVHILPYFHLFGVVADLLGPLLSGGTICFSGRRLAFLHDLERFRPTALNVPPALAEVLLRSLDAGTRGGGRLQKMMVAGAPLAERTRTGLLACGVRAQVAYGLSECSPCVSLTRDLAVRAGSAGAVLPCCEVRIRNGEIQVRGENVMLGYRGDAAATARVMDGDWLRTGDLGRLDDGFLFVTGRLSSRIVFEDGTKLDPEPVEQAICALDGVQEALLSPVRRGGRTLTELVVVVEPCADAAVVRASVSGVAEALVPVGRLVTIKVREQPLERNRLGKVLRSVL